MKKTFTKVLSLILVIVMLFSSVISASAAVTGDKIIADPSKNIVQGYVTNSGNANAYNATLLLNFLDEILKDVDMSEYEDLFKALGRIGLTIDVNSVNGLLKTLDTAKGVSGVLNAALNKDLNLKNWKTGQKRSATNDITILNNLFAFLSDNGSFLGAFVAGKTAIDIKIFGASIYKQELNLKSLLGKDVPTLIKNTLAGLVYEEGSSKYNATVKKTVDNIIFEDLLTVGVDKLLQMADDAIISAFVEGEGALEPIVYLYKTLGFKLVGTLSAFKFDTTKSIDALIAEIANCIYAKLRSPLNQMVAKYGTDLNAMLKDSGRYGACFANLFDFSKLDAVEFTSKSVEDVNKFLGTLVMQISAFKWDNSVNIGKNLENMFMWAVQNRDASLASEDVYASLDGCTNFADYALALAKMIVGNFVTGDDRDTVVAKMDSCKNATEVLTILLPYLLNRGETKIVSDKANTYEKVLGDLVGYYINDYIPLYTDANNTKRYVVSSATSIWDVLNYVANYYMVDLNCDTVFGLSMTKTSTFLQKLDQLQTVIFGSNLDYVKASTYIPALLKNILALDLGKFIDDAIINPFVKKNTSVSASEFAFRLINNALTKIVGKTVFATSSFVSIDSLVQNSALEATAKALLEGLNSRKADLIPVILYFVTALSDKYQYVVTGTNVNDVKVTYAGITLKKDTDYTVSTSVATKGKTYNLSVKGKGNFAGTYSLGTVTCAHSWDAGKITKAATCTAEGTKTFTCKLCSGTKTSKVAKIAHTYKDVITKADATKKTAGKITPTCSVCKAKKTATTIAYPKTITVKNAKVVYTGKALTNTVTVKDTAGKTVDAKNYTVSYSNNTKIGKATVKVTFKGNYTGSLSTTFQIVPGQVKSVKASKNATTSLTLTWGKVAGATYYKVEQSTDGKKWTVVNAAVKATSLNVTKLKANTKYQFRVTALDSTKKIVGTASAVIKTGTATSAPTVTLKSSKKGEATASWKAVSGATKFVVYKSTDNKKWTKVTTTKNAKTTSYTLKKLSAGKKIYVKVEAVNAYGNTASKVVNITVKK